MSKPMLIRQSSMTKIWYAVTNYKWLDAEKNALVIKGKKVDVTEEIERIILHAGETLATPASTARTDGWVSVDSGKLPDRPMEVLVFAEDIEDAYDLAMFDGHDVPKGFDCTFRVTHWRELPAAPGSVPQADKDMNTAVHELSVLGIRLAILAELPIKPVALLEKLSHRFKESDIRDELAKMLDVYNPAIQLTSNRVLVGVPQAEPPKRPKIICLCGSTRFIEQFAIQTWELELQGHIVLGCTLLPGWYCPVRDHFAESLGVKEQRDNHHLQKIDLADEVLVLNIGGYIGESTRREIEYAAKTGKPINYLEPIPAGAAQPGDAPQKDGK